MKKIVLVNGLISGAIVATWCVGSMAICYMIKTYDGNMWLGYTGMLLAFSFVFVGVKNYRDKENEGSISFGKAFQIGLLISLIASTMYVIAWAIDYHFFIPDFIDRFAVQALREAKANGASKAALAAVDVQVAQIRTMYKNPVMFALVTYSEIVPVGLVVTLITALILKKKPAVVTAL